MDRLDIHADDYALTINTSKDMLACMQAGKLCSVSIVPNMSCFSDCMALLHEAIPKLPFLPLMSVHLDFVEGKSLAGRQAAPDLVGNGGDRLSLGWGGLFLASFLPGKRQRVKAQLKREIKAQLAKTQAAIDRCRQLAKEAGVPCAQKGLRVDSHQHAHMIPVAWEAILEVVREEGYDLEYIRNSREPLGVFLTDLSLFKTYRPVNFVKNRLLFLFSRKVERFYREQGFQPMYLWGLIMSGRMDRARITRLCAKLRKQASRDGRTLEILFHPGLALETELTEEIAREAAPFYLSPDRVTEREAVMGLDF